MSNNQQNKVDLREKSTVELKAYAYDFSEIIQQYTNMLQTVNQEIQKRKIEEEKPQINHNDLTKSSEPNNSESQAYAD